MNLKRFELILILSILFGIHLSLSNYSFIRMSNVLLLIYIGLLIMKGTIPFTKKSLFVFIIICIIGLLPYMFFSNHNLSNGLSYLYYLFLGFVVIYIIQKNMDLKWTKKIVCIYWSINVLIGIYEVLTGIHLKYANIYNYTQSIERVPLGLFFNQNDYGIFLSLVAPFIFFKMLTEKKGRMKYLAAMIVNTVLIITTGSIGAYITLILNLIIAYIILENTKKWKILFLPAVFGAIYLLGQKWSIGKYIELDYIISKITRDTTSHIIIPQDRVNILAKYSSIIKDEIWGVGFGQATTFANLNYEISINPHSLIVEIGVEYGLIGVILLLALYTYALVKILKSIIYYRNNSTEYMIGSVILINLMTFFLWTNVPSRVLSGFDIIWIFIGVAALIVKNPKSLRGDILCKSS